MTAFSYKNGNKTYLDKEINKWKYLNGKLANKSRTCPKCNQLPDKNGNDWCLGKLPGVKYACCGHGMKDGIIIFKNGVCITFSNITIMKNSKLNPVHNFVNGFKNLIKSLKFVL